RRARRPGRADALRDLRPARHEARPELLAPGDLTAPHGARGGRPGPHPAAGPLQVPPPRHHSAARDHRALAHAPRGTTLMIRINVTSVLVDDQAKALEFYTKKLGFVKKTDVPAGGARWLTVVSPADPDGVELLLEPDGHPAAKVFKEALVADGM